MKLRPPTVREGLILRSGVVASLHTAAATLPVISVVAPPGYGKTTVLGQFHDGLDVARGWLTVDESDGDRAVLLRNLTQALVAAGMVADDPLHGVSGDDAFTHGVTALADAIDPEVPGVLIVDQVDHLSTRASLDLVGAVMTRLPRNVRVVVASRTGAGLPLSLLRSQGAVAEFDASDLAMTREEAGRVFETTGVNPARYLDAVLERTEGWPAGIYLTAAAIKAGAPGPGETEVRGDDVFLADYLRDELLARVPEALLTFLRRTSLLSRLSGPLCDHVLETSGSAARLAELEAANLLIVPMDRTRTWYRYHSLLRDYLLLDLERTEPEIIAGLHSRAATWFERQAATDLAIHHARSAGEMARFAGLVKVSARQAYAEGRADTLLDWLRGLDDSGEIRLHPELAAVGGFARALDGDAAGAERMAVHAFADPDGRSRDIDELGAFALVLRSCQAARGPEQALEDAIRAKSMMTTVDIEWIPTCLAAEALARLALDGIVAADDVWTDGLWRSTSMDASPFTSIALAERALAQIAIGDWAAAETMTNNALDLVAEEGLKWYITSALPFTLAARIEARKGHADEATAFVTRAATIRPRLTVALPLLAVQCLHEMARAFIEVADVAGARSVMRDASDILAVRPRLGTLVTDHETLRRTLSALPAGSVGPSSLTKAELRVLPLLVTHLSYPEIGERLYVSRHTVKTQAMSIYRKLGVSSRADAVATARQIGLISV